MYTRVFTLVVTAACIASGALAGEQRVVGESASAEAMAATIRIRMRQFKERYNPDSKDWNPSKVDGANKDFAAIEKDTARIAEGKSILYPGRMLLMGYHSELDDSDQPYSLYIPEEYDGSKAFPLVVMMHGQGMFNWLQCNANRVGENIVVAPQGRGSMDYMYVGEGDVLRVIDEVKALLKVDPNRVILAGQSMGGTGCWHLATHFPDRFGGIMPLCGNTDINVWEKIWLWKTPTDSPLAKIRHFFREDTSAVTYAENLLPVPILSLQGESDNIVNQLHATHMQEALKAAGHTNYKFYMLPLVMHGFSVNYAEGLKDFARDPNPKHVHYKTAWLKYPGAYWLKITGIEQRMKHAVIDGVVDTETKTVEIKTSNVSDFEIDDSKIQAKLFVIDGARIEPSFDVKLTEYPKVIMFCKGTDGTWKLGSNTKPGVPRKTSTLEGPVEHSFMSRFVVVADDGDDTTKTDALKSAAINAANDFNEQWKTRYGVPCRMKKATDLSDADIADSNLILYGTPKTNPLIAKVIDKLPVSLEGENIKLNGKVFSGPNAGVIMCYPNPLNPNHYVVLFTGTTPASFDGINFRFGNWFDWVPFDFRKHYDFAVFDDLTSGHHPETFLTWGFYGENWEPKPELTFAAIPEYRARLLPRVLPSVDLKKLEGARPETVFLDEVFTKSQSVNKEYLERNRTLDGSVLQIAGKNFKRGLCARFAHQLTFDCAGYQRFKATAGVAFDGVTEPCADRKQFEKVTVTVSVDGKQIFEATDRTWKSEPLDIDVDLKGGSTVMLSATGGLFWLNGSFIWADARLEGLAPVAKPDSKSAKKKK